MPGVFVAVVAATLAVALLVRHYGIHDTIGDGRFFTTLGVAVDAYLRETGVEWHDWT